MSPSSHGIETHVYTSARALGRPCTLLLISNPIMAHRFKSTTEPHGGDHAEGQGKGGPSPCIQDARNLYLLCSSFPLHRFKTPILTPQPVSNCTDSKRLYLLSNSFPTAQVYLLFNSFPTAQVQKHDRAPRGRSCRGTWPPPCTERWAPARGEIQCG